MAAYRLQNGGERGQAYLDSVTVFWGVGCVQEGRKEEGKDSEMKGDDSQPGICISEVY